MTPHEQGTLEPPRESIDDPGAHELSSDSDEHFSDAQSGLSPALNLPKQTGKEPSNTTRNDDGAVGAESDNTPGGLPIPMTVVEKIDPEAPSHGEVPGTVARGKRLADEIPDAVFAADRGHSTSPTSPKDHTLHDVPTTKVEKVDDNPSHGEVPGTESFEKRKRDAEPDIISIEKEESPTYPHLRSPNLGHARRNSSGVGRKDTVAGSVSTETAEQEGEEGFGDDFDDFEEGEADAEFDDFDDGFQEPVASSPPQPVSSIPTFPVLDFENLNTPEDIRAATQPYMDLLFPPGTIEAPSLPPITTSHPIFLTPRSASLWSQLVTPPPLQPPNWIRSRIRRLFLVSLGVPVDLDEILPASKQNKLILPSMSLRSSNSSNSPRTSTDNLSRLKISTSNNSSTSIDSQGNKRRRSKSRRRRGPPRAPHLDLVSVRQKCSYTNEALGNMTVEELREHIAVLEAMQGTAKEVLEYWTKKTDEKIGDREAFEGVIENLVKHARKVRK